jgi:hypothetical protein
VWDATGLNAGRRSFRLRGPFLLLAALLWPFAVAMSRIVPRRRALASSATGGRPRSGRGKRSRLNPAAVVPMPSNFVDEETRTAAAPTTVGQLLARRRGDRLPADTDERPPDP